MSDGDAISTRRLGDVELATIRHATLHGNPPFPPDQDWRGPGVETDEQDRTVVPVIGLFVRTPDALILVDPGAWERDEPLGGANELIAETTVDEALPALGVSPAEVTHVLVTHGHGDHCSGLSRGVGNGAEPRFPNAVCFFPRLDWETEVLEDRNGRAAGLRPFLDPVAAAGRLTLVDGGEEVAAVVTLLHTPGETAGHQAVRIDTGAGLVYYLGDLLHFPAEFEHLEWTARGRDVAAIAASRERILTEVEESRATIVLTHGTFPGWATVERTGDRSWRVVYAGA